MKQIRVIFDRKEGPWGVLKTLVGKEILVPQDFLGEWQEGDILEISINSVGLEFKRTEDSLKSDNPGVNFKIGDLINNEEVYNKIARAILEELLNPEKEEK